MRISSSLVVILAFLGVAVAAPVPADPKADRQKLEALWAELQSPDAVVRAKATFALLDHPKAAEFLTDKLPPVKASADQLKAWLTDLNSDDEKVWKAAFEELKYFDPRIGLTDAEQVECMTSDRGRFLLATVWWGEVFRMREVVRTSFTRQPGNRGFTFSMHQPNGVTDSISGDLKPVEKIISPTWKRAAVAAHILHARGTDASRDALMRLAAGHAGALPTRTATELLKAKAEPRLSEKRFEAVWNDLLPVPYAPDTVAITRGLLDLVNAPESAALLKARLPAIQANKEQVTKWLKALDAEDEKEWKPAFEQLLYFRPLLTHTWQEQCDAATTDRERCRVFWLAGTETLSRGAEFLYKGSALEPRDDGLTFSYASAGGGRITTWRTPGTLKTLDPPHWQRARMAILALERMDTAEAKAVLKQLADGHPEILPTREAKAALERLKR